MDTSFSLSRQIGRRIKRFRELKNWTQDTVAMELNMSKTGYGNIERGQAHISIDRLQEIALILDVDLSQFIIKKNEKEYIAQLLLALKANNHAIQILINTKESAAKTQEILTHLSDSLNLFVSYLENTNHAF